MQVVGHTSLKAPHGDEIAAGLAVHVAERSVAPVAVVTPVHQPVVAITLCLEKTSVVDSDFGRVNFCRRLYRAIRKFP